MSAAFIAERPELIRAPVLDPDEGSQTGDLPMTIHERPIGARSDYRAPEVDTYRVSDDIHSLRVRGPKYPPHNSDAPIVDGIDMAGLAVAIVITLGPLAVYAVGIGA
jgi:hypothetical protein